MITLEGLRVVYGRTLALDSLSFEILPGVTGLFGQNGSGKSTLLRVLAGLLRPTEGRVLLGGVELSAAQEGLRRKIGYAGHDSGLYADLTVAENVALFAELAGADPGRKAEVIDELGLKDRASDRVGGLSAGLKRRAAVARALVHDPDILLLDEPYANLDDDAAEAVSGAVRRWRAPGRACVIATHGAKRVKPFADAALILKRGRVVSYRVRVPEGSA